MTHRPTLQIKEPTKKAEFKNLVEQTKQIGAVIDIKQLAMPILASSENTALPIFLLNISNLKSNLFFSSYLKSVMLVMQGSTTTFTFYKKIDYLFV